MVAFLACLEVMGSWYQVSHCKEFIFSFLIKKKLLYFSSDFFLQIFNTNDI